MIGCKLIVPPDSSFNHSLVSVTGNAIVTDNVIQGRVTLSSADAILTNNEIYSGGQFEDVNFIEPVSDNDIGFEPNRMLLIIRCENISLFNCNIAYLKLIRTQNIDIAYCYINRLYVFRSGEILLSDLTIKNSFSVDNSDDVTFRDSWCDGHVTLQSSSNIEVKN